jgi:predicted nucleic acid-binding protein
VIPVVLDTGVMVKIFVEEQDSARATALLRAAAEGKYHLAAPDFMAIEFGNVLWKYVRRGVLREEEAWQALEEFPYDRIEWLAARLLLKDAFRFAREYDVAVYDGAFLAAAENLAVDLVTSDEALHRKVSHRLSWVRLLREFDAGSDTGITGHRTR